MNKADLSEYDEIYITDIPLSEEVADRLDKLTDDIKIVLFDHHPTAEWENKYNWATVKQDHELGRKTSATELFYNHLLKNGKLNGNENQNDLIKKFVDYVMRYDTWQWNDHINDDIELKINMLMYEMASKEEFASEMIDKLLYGDRLLTDLDKYILKLAMSKKNSYIESMKTKFTRTKFMNKDVAVFINARYTSELCNTVASENPDIDYVMNVILYESRVELRAVKDYINLYEIASNLGTSSKKGGGHKLVAGYPLPENISRIVSEMIPKCIEEVNLALNRGESTNNMKLKIELFSEKLG